MWREDKFSNLFELKNNKANQVKRSDYSDIGSLPIIDQSEKFIAGFTSEEDKKYLGQLPVVVFGDHTRHTKYIDFDFVAGADGTQILRPTEGLDVSFLYYLVLYASEKIGNYGYDRHLKHLKNFDVKYPKQQSVQREISRILRSIDITIEKTEELIAKYEQIKQGMMHDLFTRGVDQNGKLRPSYEDAPELYRETEIGFIPLEWSYDTTRDLSDKLWIGLVTTMTKNYVDDGVLLIRNSDIKENYFKTEGLINLERKFADLHESRKFRKGDVATVHTGDVGTSAVIDDQFDGAHGFATINTRVNLEKIIPQYYSDYLNTNGFNSQIKKVITGDGRDNLNLKDFEKLYVAYPNNIEEQKRVTDSLASIRLTIKKYEADVEKLKLQKAGLMQDLLTGKVSVNVEKKEAA